MRSFLPFIIVGLTSGSVYGIAGMGLVLTYKTSGIFNFAHGAFGTAAAYVFYELHVRHGWPWPVALAVCLFGAAPLLGLAMERLARRLAPVPTAMKIVATVGLLLGIQGLAVVRYGAAARSFPTFLPSRSLGVLGVNVGVDQLIIMITALAAAAALYGFFRYSTLGVAMRGVVDDPDLLSLSGTSPTSVRRSAWVIGSSFAALSGILLAPQLGLDATLLTLLVVQAFGAAAIGRFASLPVTYGGGLLVGVGAAISTKYVGHFPALSGLPPSFPFLVLFVVLLITPKGKLLEAGGRRSRTTSESAPLPRRVAIAGGVAFAVLLVMIPLVVGARLPVYTNGLSYAILFLSLGLLVRTSGQVSLCHVGFAAVGAAAFTHLAGGLGLPWPVAVVGAALLTVPVGALVAIPAIRLSGLYLALATFGFGILLERMVYRTGIMFGGADLRFAPRPGIAALSSDRGYYYVVLAFVVMACALVILVQRSRLGRLLRALADSPVALATHGTNVNQTRVLVFCLSAFLAGIAGALIGPLTGSINGLAFSSFQSLLLLVVLAIAGKGELRAAFVAAVAFAVVPSYVRNATAVSYLPVLFGVSAVVVALASVPSVHNRRAATNSGRSLGRGARSPVRERLVAPTEVVA